MSVLFSNLSISFPNLSDPSLIASFRMPSPTFNKENCPEMENLSIRSPLWDKAQNQI